MLNHLAESLRFFAGDTRNLEAEATVISGELMEGESTGTGLGDYLMEFRLEDGLAVWRYQVRDFVLEKTLLMPHMQDRAVEPVSLRSFWTGILFTVRQTNVRLLVGLRCLPTIFYGTLTVLIPLLMYDLTGSKVAVAAYGTTTLIVASAAHFLAGRSADRWGARLPTRAARVQRRPGISNRF